MLKFGNEKLGEINGGEKIDPIYDNKLQEAEILIGRYADMIRDDCTDAKIEKIIPFFMEELEKGSPYHFGIKFFYDLKMRSTTKDTVKQKILDYLYSKNHKYLGGKGVTDFKGHFNVPNQRTSK